MDGSIYYKLRLSKVKWYPLVLRFWKLNSKSAFAAGLHSLTDEPFNKLITRITMKDFPRGFWIDWPIKIWVFHGYRGYWLFLFDWYLPSFNSFFIMIIQQARQKAVNSRKPACFRRIRQHPELENPLSTNKASRNANEIDLWISTTYKIRK